MNYSGLIALVMFLNVTNVQANVCFDQDKSPITLDNLHTVLSCFERNINELKQENKRLKKAMVVHNGPSHSNITQGILQGETIISDIKFTVHSARIVKNGGNKNIAVRLSLTNLGKNSLSGLLIGPEPLLVHSSGARFLLKEPMKNMTGIGVCSTNKGMSDSSQWCADMYKNKGFTDLAPNTAVYVNLLLQPQNKENIQKGGAHIVLSVLLEREKSFETIVATIDHISVR